MNRLNPAPMRHRRGLSCDNVTQRHQPPTNAPTHLHKHRPMPVGAEPSTMLQGAGRYCLRAPRPFKPCLVTAGRPGRRLRCAAGRWAGGILRSLRDLAGVQALCRIPAYRDLPLSVRSIRPCRESRPVVADLPADLDPVSDAATSVRSVCAVVALDTHGRVLLVRLADDDSWGLPGGGVEWGESWSDAAHPECLEETGWRVAFQAKQARLPRG